jgi:hypothetical protein
MGVVQPEGINTQATVRTEELKNITEPFGIPQNITSGPKNEETPKQFLP